MGLIASGGVTSGMLGNVCVFSGQVGSGQIGTVHMLSGTVGLTADSIGSGFLGSGSVIGWNIASGEINSNHLGSGVVLSGHIASGQVGLNHLASGSVRSGVIASGQITTNHMASGIPSPNSFMVTPLMSGFVGCPITMEPISGVRAVQITESGYRIAMAAVSGRMPAHGIVVQNVLSGRPADLMLLGFVQMPSPALGTYSGYNTVYVGRSGQVVSISGSFNSGGHLSGDIGQVLGAVVNSGGFLVSLGIFASFSGGPLGTFTGGLLPPA